MSSNINWNDVIKKEDRGLNDEDFGEVQEVSNGYVFVQKGIINKVKFFIPQEKVESYDGDILRFGISLDEVKSTYQGETYPDSSPNPTDLSSKTTEREETTIPITEEKLDVTKRVEENHATITKEPITETKTVQIELVHEKVTIQKRPIVRSDNKSDSTYLSKPESSSLDSKTEFRIPIKREEPVVTKKSFVREEVIVKKRPITETREVTKEVTSEKVNVADNIV